MPITPPKALCPYCRSTNILNLKEIIFCKECRVKYRKDKFKDFGPDRMMCPECFSLEVVDLGKTFYCKECDNTYDKAPYFPFYRRLYYFCPWCGKEDILDDGRRIYCEDCKVWFSKWSIRTMRNGEGKEVWKEPTGLGFLAAIDPEKKGYESFQE